MLFIRSRIEFHNFVFHFQHLPQNFYYLLSNGRKVTEIGSNDEIQLVLRTIGGKGGFGSMLRAIGAQIEKTTNREACRDLSGRRLRDINEEKRLKSWLEKKKKEEQEKEDPDEKFQRKIEKLLAKPKVELKDEIYDASRANLHENIADSVEQGFKQQTILSSVGLKRKVPENMPAKSAKKVKGALFIDEGISSGSDSDSDDEYEEGEASGSSSSAKN